MLSQSLHYLVHKARVKLMEYDAALHAGVGGDRKRVKSKFELLADGVLKPVGVNALRKHATKWGDMWDDKDGVGKGLAENDKSTEGDAEAFGNWREKKKNGYPKEASAKRWRDDAFRDMRVSIGTMTHMVKHFL